MVCVWCADRPTTSYVAPEGSALKVACTGARSFPKPIVAWATARDAYDRNPEMVQLDERIQIDDEG